MGKGPTFMTDAAEKAGSDSFDPVEEVFSYHAPTPVQIVQLKSIREKAKELARVILQNAPSCPDRTAAIRKLREAVMTANASIVLKGASIR